MNSSTLRIAGVIAGAIAVTAVAAAAVTAAVTGDDSTLSPSEVDQLLAGATASATTTTATPMATPTTTTSAPVPTSSAAGEGNVATLIPGIVTVRCDGQLATLVSWSPNPGYRADDPVRGPAIEVSIRFENDASDADYKVTAVCGIDGVATVTLGPDDHSGRGRD